MTRSPPSPDTERQFEKDCDLLTYLNAKAIHSDGRVKLDISFDELKALRAAVRATQPSAGNEERAFYEAASREYLVEQVVGLTAALKESRQAVARLMRNAAQASWQPIETAPHETDVILGWWYIPPWKDSVPNWETELGWATRGWTINGISTRSAHGAATHWMPLQQVDPPALAIPSTERHGACQVCGETADLKCGPSRFGNETWACKDCWQPEEAGK